MKSTRICISFFLIIFGLLMCGVQIGRAQQLLNFGTGPQLTFIVGSDERVAVGPASGAEGYLGWKATGYIENSTDPDIATHGMKGVYGVVLATQSQPALGYPEQAYTGNDGQEYIFPYPQTAGLAWWVNNGQEIRRYASNPGGGTYGYLVIAKYETSDDPGISTTPPGTMYAILPVNAPLGWWKLRDGIGGNRNILSPTTAAAGDGNFGYKLSFFAPGASPLYPGQTVDMIIQEAIPGMTNPWPTATVTLSNLNHIYDGTAKSATATTSPAGFSTTITYNGSTTAPRNAGSYNVVASTAQGASATGTLIIAPRPIGVRVTVASKQYDGTNSATITGRTITNGLVGTQTLAISGGTARFATPDVGTGKLVIVENLVLGNGTGLASNYTIPVVSGTPEPGIYQQEATNTYSGGVRVRSTANSASASAMRLIYLSGVRFTLGANSAISGYRDAGPSYTAVTGNRNLNAEGILSDTIRNVGQGTGISLYKIEWLNGKPASITMDADYFYIRSFTVSGTPIWSGWYAGESAIVSRPYAYGIGTITPAPLVARANDLTRGFGVANPTPTITYTGFVNGQSAATIPGFIAPSATIAGTATASAVIGSTHAITLAGGTTPNYTLTRQGGTLTIVASNQAITFAPIADVAFGSAPFAITATASSGLPVSFSLVNGATSVTLSGSTVTLLSVGSVTIRASQTGNASWGAAAPVERTFNVLPVSVPVSLSNLNHIYNGTPKGATASATLP